MNNSAVVGFWPREQIMIKDATCLPILCLEILQHIPGWTNNPPPNDKIQQQHLSFERLSGAMTNLVYKATYSAATENQTVILRLFGQASKLFSRHQERGIFEVASSLRIGPRCLVTFENGRIEQFLPGTALTATLMRQLDVSRCIAVALSHFHVEMFQALPSLRAAGTNGNTREGSPRADDGGVVPALWDRMHGWLENVLEVITPIEAAQFGLIGLNDEIDGMRKSLESRWGSPWLVFCHNDLQHGNILMQSLPQKDDFGSGEQPVSKKQLTIIDYEYASVGDAAFDIANHWCEWAADYQAPDPESSINFGFFPREDAQTNFCRAYVKALQENYPQSALSSLIKHTSSSVCLPSSISLHTRDGDYDDSEEEEYTAEQKKVAEFLRQRALCCVPLSHLKWALWGFMQWKLSDVDYDFLKYAQIRLEQYAATKHVLI